MHGVAYNATLLSIATDFGKGITDLTQAEAFNELTKPEYDHIKIISNSWNAWAFLEDHPTGLNFDQLPAMKRLAAKDKLMVFSAGNYGQDSPAYPPAAASVDEALKFNIINVIAYDHEFTPDSGRFLAPYSDNAKGAEAYSISAAGGEIAKIYSTVDGSDSAYNFDAGTSMAAPQVSGVAALVQEAFPYMGGKQIADVILSTADNDFSNASEVFYKQDLKNYFVNGQYRNYAIFITDRHGPWTDDQMNEQVAVRTGYSMTCDNINVYCTQMTYAEVFGQGFLDAGAAVKGPKYLNAARLREVAYSNPASGYSAPSDYRTGFAFDGGTVDQFFYTVNTQGYDSVWSHNIGEQPSTAAGYETAHVGLDKQGAGRLILSGNNTFAGVSRIGGGVLEITGSLAAGVRVDGGELFVNGGTIGAPVESAATVSFAGTSRVDSLNVSGGTVNVGTAQVQVDTAVTFTGAPAVLDFAVGSAGNGSFIGAVPNFTVSPVLNLSVNKTARLSLGDTVVLFDSAATGDVNDGVLSDNLVSFTKTAKGSYTVSRLVSAKDFALSGGASANAAQAIGVFTSNVFANERLEAFSNLVTDAIRNQTPQQTARLVETVMPDSGASVQKASMETAKSLFQTVSQRVSSVKGHSGGNSFNSAGIWGKVLYNYTRSNNAFNGHSAGLILGADGEVGDGGLIGGGYAFIKTDVGTVGGNKETETHAHNFFGYGHYRSGKTLYDLSAGYTYNGSEEKTVFSFAEYGADQVSAQATVGYDAGFIVPKAGVRYINVRRHAYTDSLGQEISSATSDLMTALGGFGFGVQTGKVNWTAEALATYDCVSDSGTAQVVLPNGAGYTVEAGKRPHRWGGEVSLLSEIRVGKQTALSVEYAGSFKKDYQSHTGMLKLRYDF